MTQSSYAHIQIGSLFSLSDRDKNERSAESGYH